MESSVSHLSNVDFNLQIARGLVSGFKAVNKFGRNPDVDAAAPEDIWYNGGTWVAPTAARVHSIVSTSVNDTAAGTGARTVTMYGLNASYVEQSETVTLNGTTPVNTVNSYVMIDRAIVATAGSGGTNAGVITATAAVDGTVTLYMTAGKAGTQLCVYIVPAGYTAYLMGYSFSANLSANALMQCELFVKPFGGVFNLKSTLNIDGGSDSIGSKKFERPDPIPEKSTIKLRVTTDTNNCDVSGHFELILIAN